MPIRDLFIVEASSSILEPISHQMTYVILARLGLRDKFGDNVYVTNEFTKSSLTTDDDTHNALISKDRCDVKTTVVWAPDQVKWDIYSSRFTQAYGVPVGLDRTLIPIFYDPVAAVRLTEHQVPCSMTLEFSLQFKDRESAFMAISAITNTSLKDSVINYHDLSYNYPVNNDMFISLNQIYQLRQPTITYVDLWEYLTICSRGRVQYLKQRSGDDIQLIIKRQDLRAIGVLEYTGTAPTVEEQDRGIDRFVVDFNYTVQFARPDVLRLSFPVVVCNKLVPPWMVPRKIEGEHNSFSGILQEKALTGYYLRNIASHTQILIRRPIYDDFIPENCSPIVSAKFSQFFNAVVLLDDGDTTTIDLLNLGDNTKLHDTVVEIMKLHGNDIFGSKGIINLSVYCNDTPVDNSLLSIDENLVLTISMKNKLKRYHLVLSEATELSNLDTKWFDTLIANRTFFPITVVRNLQLLIDKKYCYIDRHNLVLNLVNQKIRNASIDSQIQTLITQGHLNTYVYSYTSTPEQFLDYLMHHRSPISDKLVYDEYVDLCIKSGLLLKSELSSGYIRTYNGYPFLPSSSRDVIPRFNTPLRIIDFTVCNKSEENKKSIQRKGV